MFLFNKVRQNRKRGFCVEFATRGGSTIQILNNPSFFRTLDQESTIGRGPIRANRCRCRQFRKASIAIWTCIRSATGIGKGFKSFRSSILEIRETIQRCTDVIAQMWSSQTPLRILFSLCLIALVYTCWILANADFGSCRLLISSKCM